jgi:MFS family permease
MSIEPIIAVYLRGLGVAPSQLTHDAGIVMAAAASGSLITAPRLGALADRVGSWKVIVGCLAATGLVMLAQAFVIDWWQLAIARVLMGMSIAGLLPAIAKLIRQSVAEARLGSVLGYLQSAQFTGQVLGPLFGALIGAHFALTHVFYLTGVMLLLCAAVAARTARGLGNSKLVTFNRL